jgi:hypothetical protein
MDLMTVALTDLVAASPDNVACDLDAETVILSLKNGEYFGLNEVAAAVWKLIQTPKRVVEVRDALLEEFVGVTLEQCETEIVGLLTQMKELGLVEVTP